MTTSTFFNDVSEHFKNNSITFKATHSVESGLLDFAPTDDKLGPDLLKKLLEFKPFKGWRERMENELNKHTNMKLHSITIQYVDIVGKEQKRILFVKFATDIKRYTEGDDAPGKDVPGIVFLRGGSVGILVILKEEGKPDRTIFTEQSRVPVPNIAFWEIPAGMIDDHGEFAGAAAKEMEEETGLVIKVEDLVDMTQLAYGDKWNGVYPSAGGSDEFLRLYVYEKTITAEESETYEGLEGKMTGAVNEDEEIQLKIFNLEDAWMLAPDAKLLSCLALYDRLKKSNKLPQKET